MLLYQIGITLIPGIGDINAKKLIAYYGSARSVFIEKTSVLSKIPGIGRTIIRSITNQDVLRIAERELKFIQQHNIKPYYFLDDEYPERLKHCVDSPVMLYSLGDANLNTEKIISIVGTRKATAYGREICEQIISGLSPLKPLIVSGLAYGIDTCSHRISLKYSLPTVGVLAHGLDRIYPGQNKALAKKMVNQGGLLTDFISETNPDRENFPKRNRIIAGLCDALIVVESAISGGALITANIATSYSRDVLAIPGKLGDKFSEGCNYLIKTNKAALAQSSQDIIEMMNWDKKENSLKPKQLNFFREFTDEEKVIYKIIKDNGSSGIDNIVIKSGLSATQAASVLLNMEFEGIIINLPGKVFKIST